jgi:dTDP-4-amino-4,6-dideoxygalactose transaminase
MIKLFKPTIKRKDMDSVLHTLVDEAPGPGLVNAELSKVLGKEFSGEQTVVVRSYVRALIIALKALRLEPGGAVAISTLSPPVYMNVLSSLGLKPLLVDVDPADGCMSAEALQTEQPTQPAAVLMHQPFGNVPDLYAFRQLGFPVIEDISQSIHSSNRKFPAGSIGSLVVLSFEDDSFLCSGGGAAVIVREKKYAGARMNELIDPQQYELLPDLNCSFVLNGLTSLDSQIERRKEYAQICMRSVMKTRHTVLNIHPGEEYTYNGYSLAILLDAKIKEVVKYAQKYKIQTAMPFSSCALQVSGMDFQDFPNSIPFMLRAILFPLYPMLSQEQLKTLVKVLSTLP